MGRGLRFRSLGRAGAVGVAVLAALTLLTACDKEPDRKRQQRVVTLLPDTPPPPPPPPKPEDKPPPKPQDQARPQQAPKPVEAPPQQLKTDEAAGDGPGGGLAAGAVTQDYSDQKIGSGTQLGGDGAESAAARLAATAYARALTQSINEYLSQDRDIKRVEYRVQVELWLSPAGGLQRAELIGGTGDAQADSALRAALSRYAGLGRPPPGRLAQPLRLQVSNRLLG